MKSDMQGRVEDYAVSDMVLVHNGLFSMKTMEVRCFRWRPLLYPRISLWPECWSSNPSSLIQLTYDNITARSEVLAVVIMKIIAFWDVTRCSLVDRYQQFGGTYCRHLPPRTPVFLKKYRNLTRLEQAMSVLLMLSECTVIVKTDRLWAC
jgi:hypothetical protein